MKFRKDKKEDSENKSTAAEAPVEPQPESLLADTDLDLDAPQDSPAKDDVVIENDDSAGPDAALIKENVQLKLEVAEFKDKYLRSLADFENFKKRALKERSDMLKYQGEKVLADILPIVDNYELALAHSKGDPEKLREGIELIYKLLQDLLSRWEVRYDPAVGKDLDPSKHQALSQVPVDDAKPGTVINEVKKAYFYKDKLLRVGDVVVACQRPAPEAAGEGEEAKDSPV